MNRYKREAKRRKADPRAVPSRQASAASCNEEKAQIELEKLVDAYRSKLFPEEHFFMFEEPLDRLGVAEAGHPFSRESWERIKERRIRLGVEPFVYPGEGASKSRAYVERELIAGGTQRLEETIAQLSKRDLLD